MQKTTTLIGIAALVGGATIASGISDAQADVGVGVAIGEPSGLSLQLDTPARSAVNIALGVDIDNHNHVHGDYVVFVHEARLARDVWMPLYVGGGGFVKDHPADLGPHAGVRMPLGLQLELDAPIEVFGEVAPQLVLADTDETMPHRGLYLTGAAGVRAVF